MSTTRKRKFTLKHLCIIIAALLLASIVGFLAYQKFFKKDEEKTDPTSQSQNVQTTQESQKTTSQESTEEKDPKAPVQYEGENPNSKSELSGVISSTRVADGKLTILTNIDQFLSSGTCELTLSSGDKTFTESANIITMVSTSTCDGFDIPISNLSAGTWQINIKLTSGDKQGNITGETKI